MSKAGVVLHKVFGAAGPLDGLHLGAGKSVLPPSFKDGDRSSVGQVERTKRRLHGKANTRCNVRILFEPIRQAHGLRTEHEDVALAVTDVRIGRFTVGGVGENPFRLECGPRGIDVLVDSNYGEIVVVEAGAAQLGIGKIEAEGLHQVKLGPRDGGQTDGVARIARDFWSVEEDAEHGPILVSPVEVGCA